MLCPGQAKSHPHTHLGHKAGPRVLTPSHPPGPCRGPSPP
jgi:hypothetical protein